ncbi:MAG: hypothetical protein H7Y05_11805 [Steroidobacteraceae bacterium]|nr:hypothetical protein [Deltaproteobacteria bacterium]
MKKISVVFLGIILLFFVFGCSKSFSKPDKHVVLELATKSAAEVFLLVDSNREMINTKWGPAAVKKVEVGGVKFSSEPTASELVKRKDLNGVERDMWVVDISAEANVIYSASTGLVDKSLNRNEILKYKMFVYKTNENKYLYENGAVEGFKAAAFI